MQRLWTPWRMGYLVQDKTTGCVFCQKLCEDNDRENLILYRGKRSCVVMNLYPYNTGHLMVIPHEHIATLEDMPADTLTEMVELVQLCLRILREVLRPDGFNMGANIGKAAGAGIDTHVHIHVVPRWEGDTNFMPIFAETRVMPEMLLDTYDRLKKEFDQTKPVYSAEF